jgi:predicted Rossmann-fold nucleotide-binding protein
MRAAAWPIQTGKLQRFPAVLFGSDYWRGLLDWVRDRLLAGAKIEQADLDLLHLSDSVPAACRHLLEAYQNETWKAPGQGGGPGPAPAGYP